MRKVNSILLVILFLNCLPSFGLAQSLPIVPCSGPIEIKSSPEAFKGLKEKMEELVNLEVPGFVIGIESSKGSYYGASGYAQIEEKVPMGLCHLQFLQSISKTYLAVTVLQLYESGKIDLDQSIRNYLPKELGDMVVDSDKMTVRMLLNHTSGIPEYNYLPSYVSILLQDPTHPFQPIDYIKLIAGKSPDFEPGTKYSYRNSGFVLLALMMDHMTGDHAKYMQEHIFDPLSLTQTYYRNDPDYLNYPELVNGYWDRFGNSIIENSSKLQVENVSKLVGDDGIVTTPKDALTFIQELFGGKLIQAETLKEMEEWVSDSKGNPAYGLGLDYTILAGNKAYGHSGGGLGAGSQLYYFPDHDVFFFMAINLATVTDSPIHMKAEKVLNEIYELMVKN